MSINKVRARLYSVLNVTAVTSVCNLYSELNVPDEKILPRATFTVLDDLLTKDENIYNDKYTTLGEVVVQLKAYFPADVKGAETTATAMLETMRRLISPANLTDTVFRAASVDTQTQFTERDTNGVWIAIGRYRVKYNMLD